MVNEKKRFWKTKANGFIADTMFLGIRYNGKDTFITTNWLNLDVIELMIDIMLSDDIPNNSTSPFLINNTANI